MPFLDTGLAPYLLSGMSIGVLHGLMPNHWLPFVAIGRTFGWSPLRTVKTSFIASAAHGAVTLGIAATSVFLGGGVASLAPIGHRLGGLLILGLGLAFLLKPQVFGHKHIHHPYCLHSDRFEEKGTTLTVTLALVLSPCFGIVPIAFGAAARMGASAGLLVSVVSTLLTVLSLNGSVALASRGWSALLEKVPEGLERWIVIVSLLAIGLMMLLSPGD